MGWHAKDEDAPFDALDGPHLVAFGNWVAESLDISELPPAQVLLLNLMLDRCLKALWDAFPEVLMPYAQRMLAGMENKDEDE